MCSYASCGLIPGSLVLAWKSLYLSPACLHNTSYHSSLLSLLTLSCFSHLSVLSSLFLSSLLSSSLPTHMCRHAHRTCIPADLRRLWSVNPYPPPCFRQGLLRSATQFCMTWEGLNSGPHACSPSTVPTEPYFTHSSMWTLLLLCEVIVYWGVFLEGW